jgi:hypothetical protein
MSGMLKLIGAGFGRTGTASTKAALERLGLFPCYHMFEVGNHPDHSAIWDRAALGERVDFGVLLGDWAATVDWPGCTFYRELMETFPTAKVLLNVRDPSRWYESCLNTIYPGTIRRWSDPPEKWQPDTSDDEAKARISRRIMINHLIWDRTFHGRFEDRDYAIGVFKRHIEEVKNFVPAGRLLVYEVNQGWKPICDFLGVPVPEGVPFPRLNDTASFTAGTARAQVFGNQPVDGGRE